MTLRVYRADTDVFCEACGEEITGDSESLVIVDPTTDQLVVVCATERKATCQRVITTGRLPNGMPSMVVA